VDEFFRTKRSWSKVKDKIVSDYVDCYLKTVHNLQRPILIVDGFAGPGRFGDDTDSSPLIICNAISKLSKGRVAMRCLFADAHPGHRAASVRTAPLIAEASSRQVGDAHDVRSGPQSLSLLVD